MLQLAKAAPNAILDALEGVAYLADRSGELLYAGGRGWSEFSASNGSLFPPSAVVGRNLFEVIDGEEVRSTYRALHDKVVAGESHLTFEFRCDSAAVERLMRMSLGPVVVDAAVAGVLYQSTLVSSVARVPLRYLSNDEALRRHRASLNLPLVTICAFCADIREPSGEWCKPEEHYRRGGSAEAQLSHGVCGKCRDDVVQPLLEGAGA